MESILYLLKPDIIITGELAINSAPDKRYRMDITAIELFEMFPDDDSAEHWFESFRWGGKPSKCPIDETEGRVKENPNRMKPLPYYCGACRRHFSVNTGSVMHRSKIGFQ